MEVHLLTGKGEGFVNADGTSRQAEITSCRIGEPVELVREPTNPRDPMAVGLFSVCGVQLGYLSREHAR